MKRLILCGSIVSREYNWELIRKRLPEKVLNDCGTHDIWPVLASSGSWGYGPSGTFGFGTRLVRDRFHKFTHSQYFNREFVRDYWAPYIRDGQIKASKYETSEERRTPPWWQSMLTVVKLRWLFPVLLVVFLILILRSLY